MRGAISYWNYRDLDGAINWGRLRWMVRQLHGYCTGHRGWAQQLHGHDLAK
jgi:hypothetical protein